MSRTERGSPATAAAPADFLPTAAAGAELRGGRLRAAVRGAAILAVTAVAYGFYMAGSAALRGRPRRRAAWRQRWYRRWGAGVARGMGLSWRVEGRPPEPPFLLVVNHLSYADVFPLLAVTGAAFVAKAEVGTWPLIGHLSRVGGTILIDRAARRDLVRVGREIEQRLAAGHGVIVFPEGTTGRGDAILPLKASLLEVAARNEIPVFYATVAYRTPPGSPPPADSVCWWGDAELLPHLVRLLRVPGVEATLRFAAEPIADRDRKRLAARLREAMERIFEPSAAP